MPFDGSVGAGVRSPTSTEITGSSLSGSSGASNRTYTISADTGGFQVVVNGKVLHKTQEYTYDGSTLTFLDPISDSDYIQLQSFAVP